MNSCADFLSRQKSTYEWMLHPRPFECLDQMYGPLTINRFASKTTKQIEKYNSYFHDPCTSGVDALAQGDWRENNNYVNPPFVLIPKIPEKIFQEKACATLIAPVWPAQPWFNKLLSVVVLPPVKMCIGRFMLRELVVWKTEKFELARTVYIKPAVKMGSINFEFIQQPNEEIRTILFGAGH